jgi:hypothetical protein
LRFLIIAIVSALLVIVPIQAAKAQGSSSTIVSIVPAQNNVKIDETLTVNITISNVQNLYGLDVTVSWNNSALQILNINDRLGVEAYTGGVLHKTSSNPIEIAVNSTSQEAGEYQIVATSQGDAAPFSGTGTIATLTFNVTSTGQSTINVVSDLADHPEVGETNSEPIAHNDVGATVNGAPIPEFPQAAVFGLLLVCVTVALLTSKKMLKKKPLELKH